MTSTTTDRLAFREMAGLQDRPFIIKGRLDSLAQLIGAGQPYAVQLDITSGTLEARIEGTIARPLEGAGP